MHLYVYYDVPAARRQDVRTRVDAMHAALATEGVACRLMRRAEPRADGSETWMEIYADVDAAFEARLLRAIDASGIAGQTGPRHAERFVDVDGAEPPPCA